MPFDAVGDPSEEVEKTALLEPFSLNTRYSAPTPESGKCGLSTRRFWSKYGSRREHCAFLKTLTVTLGNSNLIRTSFAGNIHSAIWLNPNQNDTSFLILSWVPAIVTWDRSNRAYGLAILRRGIHPQTAHY